MLSLLKLLPLPLRIGVVAVGLFFLWTVAQGFAGLLLAAAIVAWGIAAAALLYAAGTVPVLGTLPLVGPLVQALAGSIAAPPASPGRPSAPVPAPAHANAPATKAPVKVDRAAVAARALRDVRALLGEHPAVAVILDEIVPLAQAHASEKKRLFGLARPWLVVIHGPRGVGKSSVARALADLLVGLDVVAVPTTLSVEPPPPGRADTEWSQVLERGLDAVLLLDNADWLAEPSQRGAGPVSHGVLATLLNLAARGAGKVAVIASLTTEAFDTAFSSGADAYLKRMTFRPLECLPLDDAALARIFVRQLEQHGVRCSEAATDEIVRYARGTRGYLGPEFDYAEAMRRAAESVAARAKIAGRPVAEREDVRLLSSERP